MPPEGAGNDQGLHSMDRQPVSPVCDPVDHPHHPCHAGRLPDDPDALRLSCRDDLADRFRGFFRNRGHVPRGALCPSQGRARRGGRHRTASVGQKPRPSSPRRCNARLDLLRHHAGGHLGPVPRGLGRQLEAFQRLGAALVDSAARAARRFRHALSAIRRPDPCAHDAGHAVVHDPLAAVPAVSQNQSNVKEYPR